VNVVGLTGREPVIEMIFQTFCGLCKRVIRRGDEAVSVAERRGQWFIHPDCALAKVLDNHTAWFHQDEVKKKSHKTQTRVQQKKVFTSDGTKECSFCRKAIPLGDTYVKQDKKEFHNSGRTSCIRRYRAVNNRMVLVSSLIERPPGLLRRTG
jgi:hypothetical protein